MTDLHFLLTYSCTYECDHCFLYCGPQAGGTFTLARVQNVLEQARLLETIRKVYFEGGEPFLFYPLMIQAARLAHDMGFDIGVVTNGYWATSAADAELWLRPLADLKITELSISDDALHNPGGDTSPASIGRGAAEKMGLPVGIICIESPTIPASTATSTEKGQPIVGGDVRFRGRAVEKLAEGLPTRPWHEFKECPYEELVTPERVHIDPFGYVHICQGLCMGNLWEKPLSELCSRYNARQHPICGPLVKGGPVRLAEEFNLDHDDAYIDACHFCYLSRRALVDRYPQLLAPRQVYGLD